MLKKSLENQKFTTDTISGYTSYTLFIRIRRKVLSPNLFLLISGFFLRSSNFLVALQTMSVVDFMEDRKTQCSLDNQCFFFCFVFVLFCVTK